ncbi:MAG: hypothetical protein AB9869_33835 [Verrucomicrobiia bacterium]
MPKDYLRSTNMTETLSIKVPKAQKARLKALAARRKTSLTRLMLDALEALSKEGAKAVPCSCYELTRDLFEQPENLGASPEGDRSTNKRRMKSFGRTKRR